MDIVFHVADIQRPRFPKGMKDLLKSLFRREKTKASSLSYIFCSDEFLLKINREFLNHDTYTDIITFNLADRNQPVDGEIYISLDRVKDNASNLNVSLKQELSRVMIHGALHLCGYKDKSSKDQGVMRSKEDAYLKLLA